MTHDAQKALQELFKLTDDPKAVDLYTTVRAALQSADKCPMGEDCDLTIAYMKGVEDGKKLPPQSVDVPELGQRFSADYDDFTGTVIGSYRTKEGKDGLVLQQDGTRVVHVYGRKRLTPTGQGGVG